MRLLPLLLLVVACKKPAPQPAAEPQPTMLPIATINDFHGALYESPSRQDPTQALGGLPWLVSAVDHLRTEEPDLLLLDGGDLFQGSWPVNASNGWGSLEAFELLGVDAAAVGNHEFDYGAGQTDGGKRGALELAASEASFHWLSANIQDADGNPWGPEGIAPWVVIDHPSGVKVGIIGLTTQDTPQTTLRKNVDDLTFLDPVETVRQALPELEAAGAQVTVVVGHLTGACHTEAYGQPNGACEPEGEIGRLVTELEPGQLDLIVAGHAHTLWANRFGETFVLESRSKGHMVNRIDLAVGPEGVVPEATVIHEPWLLSHAAVEPGCSGNPFPTDPLDVGGVELTPSPDALALIEQLETEAGSLCDEVGCNAVALGRTREAESGVGDWAADAILAAVDADLALTNSGGLRADLPAGTLRREHVQQVMPFENRIVVVELTGAELTEMLRIGSSGAHGILQISGGSYHFDPEVDAGTDRNGDDLVEEWERDRLCSGEVAGSAIDAETTYRVATIDFLTGGGDHFGPVFDGKPVVEQGPLLRDALANHLGSLEECLGSTNPLPAPEAPRIRRGPC